jgi:hypothetical protein
MAARKLRDPNAALYQDGRGKDPMIEVGNTTSADALYICLLLHPRRRKRVGVYRAGLRTGVSGLQRQPEYVF